MIEVVLTPDEVRYAAYHGIDRRWKKLSGQRDDREQNEMSSWDNEIEGVCAELAWCKHRKIYWTGLSKIRRRDAGDCEVRWTGLPHGGLIIYDGDDDDGIYILARGRAPNMQFIGWLTGKEARKVAVPKGRLMIAPAHHLCSLGGLT